MRFAEQKEQLDEATGAKRRNGQPPSSGRRTSETDKKQQSCVRGSPKGVFRRQTPEEIRLEGLLASADNLHWLDRFVWWHVRDHLLSMMTTPPDPQPITELVLGRICAETVSAILKRLRKKYPDAAGRTDDALVRTYKPKTMEFYELALTTLAELLQVDLWRHPDSTLAARAQRLIPALQAIPSMRGKSRLGETFWLIRLKDYEEALTLIPERPSRARDYGYTAVDLQPLTARWSEIYPEKLCQLSRDAIARKFACRGHGDVPEFSPRSFRRVLHDLQAKSLSIDKGLARARKINKARRPVRRKSLI